MHIVSDGRKVCFSLKSGSCAFKFIGIEVIFSVKIMQFKLTVISFFSHLMFFGCKFFQIFEIVSAFIVAAFEDGDHVVFFFVVEGISVGTVPFGFTFSSYPMCRTKTVTYLAEYL